MKKIYKFMGLAILAMLFLVNFIPHYNKPPLHIDSWIQFSWAKETLRNGIDFTEPFSNHSSSYPPGARIILAAFLAVTGLELGLLTPIIAGLLMMALGAGQYLLAKELFKSEKAGLAVMAFTPLVLSNITVLGPFFITPLTFGMIFSMLLFYFALRENVLPTILLYLTIVLTHRSSSVFAGIGLGIIFLMKLYEKKYRTIAYLTAAPVSGILVYVFLKSFEGVKSMLTHHLINSKQPPYISFNLMYTSFSLPFYYLFIVLLALGLFLIILRERKSRYFIVGLFALLALNAFAYKKWDGFLLVYRRLFGFLFLLVPFFVGYAVYFLAIKLQVKTPKKFAPYVFIILLILLVPWAVQLNTLTHKYPYVYVTKEEHRLFTEFGQKHPGEYLVASNLQYYSLPYYNIEPVMGNIVATGSKLHFDELYPCYQKMSEECFAEFFEKREKYKYIYTKIELESKNFTEYMKVHGKKIFMYKER